MRRNDSTAGSRQILSCVTNLPGGTEQEKVYRDFTALSAVGQSCTKSAIRHLQEGPVKRTPRRKMGIEGSQGIKRKNGAGKQDFLAQVNRTCAAADKTNQARAQKEQKRRYREPPTMRRSAARPDTGKKSQQSEEKNHAFPPMLSCHATSLSGWAVPGSPATFSRPDQASCRKKKAQKAKSRKSARPPCGNCHTRIFLCTLSEKPAHSAKASFLLAT